ncbi:hypothetical protein IAD21_05046 [Abditibacteriota bacterium]|nr:hypothetical protein IAD21_05046 [Abditibacteriota bacterium]
MPILTLSAPSKPRNLLSVFALILVLLVLALGGLWRRGGRSNADAIMLPRARPIPSDAKAETGAIRFLQARVQSDPDNFIVQNQLSGYFLQRLRETSDHRFLTPALHAARASLHAVSEQQNTGGLSALARAELAGHDFAGAATHARRLMALEPTKSGPHSLLGDALLEMGDYSGAAREFARAQTLGADGVEIETRQARLDVLYGRTDKAQEHFTRALALALDWPVPPRETISWCYWQMGETAFLMGDLDGAERHYRDALTVNSEDFRAQAGLGRVLAARGDLNGAINQFKSATTFLSSLGDLYHLAGREREARATYKLVEFSFSPAKATTASMRLHARLHLRELALFYADHDLHAPDAYDLAKRDYVLRHDIYGADVLAWTAFKAGHLSEAQVAARTALRLGTPDARLYYHAGLIERALGNHDTAKKFLQQALDLNPHFDPLQAPLAQRALDSMS